MITVPVIVRNIFLRIDYSTTPDMMIMATGCHDVGPTLTALHPPWTRSDVAHSQAVLIDMKKSYTLEESLQAIALLGARPFQDNAALWTLSDREPTLQLDNGIMDPGTIWLSDGIDCVAVLTGSPSDRSRGVGLGKVDQPWPQRCFVLAELP